MAEHHPIPADKRFHDLTGRKFGRLTVESYAGRDSAGSTWTCRCECGQYRVVRSRLLKTGRQVSCGCLRREKMIARNTVHGKSGTRSYFSWQNMMKRCTDRSAHNYPLYGGRGITVCERWKQFVNFLSDMGERPSIRHSLDRIDVNGNYEPSNCRWATQKEQCRNTRAIRLLTFRDKTQCVTAWADDLAISAKLIDNRLRRGWSVDRALSTTVKPPQSEQPCLG